MTIYTNMMRRKKMKTLIFLGSCVLVLLVYKRYGIDDFISDLNRSGEIIQLPQLNVSNFPSIHKESVHLLGPKRLVLQAECAKLIEGDRKESVKAKSVKFADLRTQSISDEKYINITTNCTKFKQSRRYFGKEILSYEERTFPIAFSILLYKDVEQTERLLRAIYRPNNIYCLHVDLSAKHVVHQAIQSLVKCFDNVFISSKLEDVIYSSMSRLKADLNCMKDLLASEIKWKYFINLPSQQFPLKTNRELVKILRLYNGANDVEGITQPHRMMRGRYRNKFVLNGRNFKDTGVKKEDPPHNISVVKGSAYGVFSRAFVEFVLTEPISKDLLDWMEDIKSPDEYYWATLNHNKVIGAPGGYFGVPDEKPWLATYAIWGGTGPCHGKFVRGVCVYGVGDLTELVSRKEMFANKFYNDYQPLAIGCMEEWLWNKTFSALPFESYYYRNLPFINKEKSR